MPERAPVQLSMVIPPGPWTGALEDGTVGIPGVSWECIADIVVRDGSSIVHASDLAGKRIGTWLSIVAATTVGVMLMLEQGYSVPLADIEWNTGDPKKLQ